MKVAREPCGRRPIARRGGRHGPGNRHSDVEPAGGTTTPFVRWTSGACCFEEPEPDRMTEPTTTTNPPRTALPKAYVPSEVEGRIYERWLAADVFPPDGAGSTAEPDLPPFTIIQPPPNVTGSLHLGHAQRTAVEDLMIRHARMRGHPTLFLPGLDHASIAAQFVLDGILAKEGESRASLGRERYLERMRAFSDSTKPVMLGQQRRVGPRPTGAASGTRWTRARQRPSGSPSSGCTATAWRTAPRHSSTGARGVGPASAISRSSRPRRRERCGSSATT